jgi:uncharacterized protein
LSVTETTRPSTVPRVPTPAAPVSTRRRWIKRTLLWGIGAVAAGTTYSAIEASWITVERVTFSDPLIPTAWRGTKIVQLTDLHHGPVTGLPYIEKVVQQANALEPDIIFLTGDYPHRNPKYVAPCFEALSQLRAKQAIFSVPGNHDYYQHINNYRQAIARHQFTDLTNRHVQLTRDQQSLYIAGLDDYMWGRPNQTRAYDGIPREVCVLLLAHNPDIIQTINDQRIRLTCCGHTHGGQINLPLYGPPIKPFGYKSDYIAGMYDTPTAAKVYVSRGLGTILPPLRFNSPPEVTLITLDG